MKTVKHRKEDGIGVHKEDLMLIKEFMEDDRNDVDYSKDWGELMNVLEVLETTQGVSFEFGDNTVKLNEKLKTFSSTFMWHNYRTRRSVTYLLIVDVIRWLNSDYRRHLLQGINDGIVTKNK